MTEPLRILLVDDHVLFRKGVAALLASRRDVEVVGEAGDGLEAIARARETIPDVILMDVSMPICSGLEAVPLIKAEMPHVKIIMLTVSDDDRSVFTAIKNGAEGYILKNLEPQQLFDYLEGTRRGEAAIPGRLAAKILREFRESGKEEAQPQAAPEGLTAREWAILEQLVKGASNRDIAAALFISENTVKIHVRNILEKLHLQNRIQAAVYAVRQGMAGGSSPRQ
jgi:DNA-binding NarL/FixJ family response regulator